jgi:hypothetical protein
MDNVSLSFCCVFTQNPFTFPLVFQTQTAWADFVQHQATAFVANPQSMRCCGRVQIGWPKKLGYLLGWDDSLAEGVERWGDNKHPPFQFLRKETQLPFCVSFLTPKGIILQTVKEQDHVLFK